MSIAAWCIAAALAYLAFGSFIGSCLRSSRVQQTRPVTPPIAQVRDERLDIEPALRRRK